MSALVVRRWVIVLALPIAGILTVVATLADPAPTESGANLVEAYAADPDPLNVKALAYHFAYALWLAVVFPLVGLVRRRGGGLANLAGLLAFLGISTIPGFLIADFIDSAMGRIVGVESAVRIGETAQEFWGFAVMAIPGQLGLLLALPLATLAMWRAGLLPWWGFAATAAGLAAFIGFGATLVGNILLTAAFVALSATLARVDFEAGRTEPS